MSNFFILRQTKEEWEAEDTARPANYVGVESDVVNGVETGTLQAKLFDGMNPWNELEYWNPDGNSGGGGGSVNARTESDPTLHPVNEIIAPDGTISGSTVDLTGSIVVPTPGVNIHYLSTYANFATAISTIGSTAATLIIDENASVTVNIPIPATLTLVQANEATITLSAVGSLVFQGQAIQGNERALFAASPTPEFLYCNQGQVDLTTNTLNYTAHGFVTGQQLIYTLNQYGDGDGSLPIVIGGLTDNAIYYAIRVDADHFQWASSYAHAIGVVPIDLTAGGHGQFFLHHTPLYWSGTESPPTVSSELIDTSNNSEQDRTNILTRALTGHGVWIEVYPRVIDKAVFLADGHNIRQKAGLHVNIADGTSGGWPYYPFNYQFALRSNSIFTQDPGAICQQSSVDYANGIITIGVRTENSKIIYSHFRQDRPETATGSPSPLTINGGVNNHILDNYCDGLKCYVLSINPVRPEVDNPRQCSVMRNTVRNTLTQVFFIGGGDELDFSYNIMDMRDLTAVPPVACSPFDVEPNSSFAVLTNIRIEGNTFDTRGLNNGNGAIGGWIRFNPAGVENPKNIYIRNNNILGSYPTETPVDSRALPIDLNGIDNFEVSGNQVEGYGFFYITVRNSRRGRIFNNTSINGNGGVWFLNTQDAEVFETKYLNDPDYHLGALTPAGVSEAAYFETYFRQSTQGYWLGTYKDADTVAFAPGSPGLGIDGGYVFTHFLQSPIWINEDRYTITGINNANFGSFPVTEITVSPPFGAVPVVHLAVPNTDISTSTNQIHYVAHGYVTGAGIAYVTGTLVAADGGLFGGMFVIRVDADNFKLARSYEDVQANNPVDIVTVPVGTHDFYTTAVAFPTGNDFHDNENGVQQRMATSHSTTLVRKGTVTIDPASINATTVSSQTFTLFGAKAADALTLNPPTAGLTAGLLIQQSFVSADNTITIVFYNSTGAPIDQASGIWTYTLNR